jgi:hypothetical protein
MMRVLRITGRALLLGLLVCNCTASDDDDDDGPVTGQVPTEPGIPIPEGGAPAPVPVDGGVDANDDGGGGREGGADEDGGADDEDGE